MAAAWAGALLVGFALVAFGSGSAWITSDSVRTTFRTDLYVSGTTLFTLGLGDVRPGSRLTRALIVLEAGTGFGFLAIVIAYLVLSINVYLETHAFGEFQFGYGWMGPTEARVLLITLNTLALFRPPLPFHIGVVGATIFDVLGAAAALGMAGLLLTRVVKNLNRLAAMEPPRS